MLLPSYIVFPLMCSPKVKKQKLPFFHVYTHFVCLRFFLQTLMWCVIRSCFKEVQDLDCCPMFFVDQATPCSYSAFKITILNSLFLN